VKASDLTDLPFEELQEKMAQAKSELFNLRFQLATNQLDNTARMKDVRRDIARIASVMREQEIAAFYEMEDKGDE
jgi:large subunit ribosomal protein L29